MPSTLAIRPPASGPLAVAAAAAVVIAITSLALGVVEAWSVQVNRMVVGVGSTILLLGYAIALGVLARGLWRGRRWSRGPTVALNILHIFVGASFRGGSTTWVAVVVIALALTSIVAVLVPSSTAILTADD